MIWRAEPLPEGVKPTRVHAVLVTKDGRVFLRYKGGNVRKVTGGHIDPGDKDAEAALRRELLEEINCKVDCCDYLGYIEYINDDEREYWVRMVARLSEILPAQPDPDRAEKWIYGRALMLPEAAEEVVVEDDDFREIMAQIMQAALRTAKEKGYFTEPINTETEILNQEVHEVDMQD